jgi:cob(I)alamin adenosyltransferase
VADFDTPNIGIAKVYTRSGDKGDTALVGGQRVPKDDVRLDAYGTVDELNAHVGLARFAALDDARTKELGSYLLKVQHALFNLGSILATLPADISDRQPRIREQDISELEAEMDRLTAQLPALKSFVLPGGGRLNALLHICRTVCRRAERRTVTLSRMSRGLELEVRYLNRLSDAFFVWSRWAAKALGHEETLWDPNQA